MSDIDLTDAIAAAHAALDERFYPGPTEDMVAVAIEAAAPLIAAKALRDAAIFPGSQLSYAAREWLRAHADALETKETPRRRPRNEGDPMTTRTDHAARAEELLTEERRHQFAKIDALTEALTHATLALGEQQQIANLIALASMAEDDSKHEVLAGTLGNEAVWTLATTLTNGPDDEFEIVNPDIAAALGIEVRP